MRNLEGASSCLSCFFFVNSFWLSKKKFLCNFFSFQFLHLYSNVHAQSKGPSSDIVPILEEIFFIKLNNCFK